MYIFQMGNVSEMRDFGGICEIFLIVNQARSDEKGSILDPIFIYAGTGVWRGFTNLRLHIMTVSGSLDLEIKKKLDVWDKTTRRVVYHSNQLGTLRTRPKGSVLGSRATQKTVLGDTAPPRIVLGAILSGPRRGPKSGSKKSDFFTNLFRRFRITELESVSKRV